MPLGDDAVRLAEMLVVGPEQVGGASGLDSKERSARIASSRSTSTGVGASVGEGGRHQHVGPAVLEGVGDLDVGLLLAGLATSRSVTRRAWTNTRSSSAAS